MRWKYQTAIEILEKLEPDPKIDRNWETVLNSIQF